MSSLSSVDRKTKIMLLNPVGGSGYNDLTAETVVKYKDPNTHVTIASLADRIGGTQTLGYPSIRPLLYAEMIRACLQPRKENYDALIVNCFGDPMVDELRQIAGDKMIVDSSVTVGLNVGHVANMGQVVVVHGGLVPGVDLDKQDPFSVMNMLSIDLATHVPSSVRDKGMKWTKLLNKHQSLALSSKNGVTTVIYGHDVKYGLSLKEYTKRIDSGCVKGGKLTAYVISDGGQEKTVQVRCQNYMEEENAK